jgi:hypothetical protein
MTKFSLRKHKTTIEGIFVGGNWNLTTKTRKVFQASKLFNPQSFLKAFELQ